MGFLIREATEDDYQQLCQLYSEVDALHNEALPQVFRESNQPARTKEFITQIIADEETTLFVAECSDQRGQVIGFVHLGTRQVPDVPIFVPRQYGWISEIVVKKEWQRSGVGRRLAERAHQWLLDRGVEEVRLVVWEFNRRAIGFYEELGYTTANRMMWRSLKLREQSV